MDFNPQGPRGPRHIPSVFHSMGQTISIHKALAGLDRAWPVQQPPCLHFNPQGPRGPRPLAVSIEQSDREFQSTRPSRASTWFPPRLPGPGCYFNPQGPRGPRHVAVHGVFHQFRISIHKALAGLDPVSGIKKAPVTDFNPQGPRGPRQQNYPTIPPHPPNFLCIMSSPPYFNLLHPFTQPIFTAFPLFFRCESPRHFMLAWHSHLV